MTAKPSRPTSPHLQIYQLPLTAIISISHRITGVALSVGLLLVVFLFYTISQGSTTYAAMQVAANFFPVKLFYGCFIFALYFHLCHGIRHLIWDIGESFEVSMLNQYALIELVMAFLLTIATFLLL